MRWRTLFPAACLGLAAAALAACGGDAEEPAISTVAPSDGSVDVGESTTTSSTEPATPTTLDQSPFCVAIRGLDDLGTEVDDPTPEQVLSDAEAFLDLLAEAQVNAPEDAPPALEALIDDWRAITEAIGRAAGDVDAAYAALAQEQPDLYARLGDPDAHREAFEFFATRCGAAIS